MNYLAFIQLIASLALSISGATIPPKSPGHKQGGNFSLTDFFVSSSPHSTITVYEFGVTDGHTSANCSGNISTGPYISSLQSTCCGGTDCNWMFSFLPASNTSGYVLNVTNISQPRGQGDRDVALRFYPYSAIQTYQNPFNPNGNYQYLETDRNFTLVYFVYPWNCEN